MDVNFALDQHQIIRLNRNPRPGQRFHQAGHVAPGVDDPADALFLQIADELLELSGNRWILKLGEDGSVEIG